MHATHKNESTWPNLLRIAEGEVRAVLQGLPAPLRARAREVPVIYQPCPTAAQQADGIDADLMGLFVGLPFPEMDSGAFDLPAEIFLFLDNICDEAEGGMDVYRDEVRKTYLHELGHYLGLGEDDLVERGLE